MNSVSLLEVHGLSKHYPVRPTGWFKSAQVLKAVDNISFHLEEGETLGLVGESGSGKSTTGRLILRLIEPTAGQVLYRGQSLFDLSQRDFKPYRKNLQMIFQDPAGSLNPAYTVYDLIAEPLRVYDLASTERQRRERVAELMMQVGLDPQMSARSAHEFSGGQKQRIGIARALAVQAKLIIADEPVSALDVSIQSQILNLMQELKQRLGLAYLFIAHDLAVVKYMSQRVAVMYLGRVVEPLAIGCISTLRIPIPRCYWPPFLTHRRTAEPPTTSRRRKVKFPARLIDPKDVLFIPGARMPSNVAAKKIQR